MHRNLRQQLNQVGLVEGAVPTEPAWQTLVQGLNRTFEERDQERDRLEQAVELFAGEMATLGANLAVERDRLRAVFEAALVGILRCDLSGHIESANRFFQAMVGYSEEELRGSHPSLLLHPADRQEPLIDPERLGLAPGATYRVARRFLHRSGAGRCGELSISPMRNPQGKILFYIAVIEDLTERNQLEIATRHAQRMDSVGRLAAGLAHEINTPIQFIGDNVSFLQTSLRGLMGLCESYQEVIREVTARGGLTGPQQSQIRVAEEMADVDYLRVHGDKAFAAVLDGISRVAVVVNAMKSFGHVDHGKRRLADINASLRNTVTVARGDLASVAEVKMDLGALHPIPCYAAELNQVFLNLLMNAAHAIAEATVTSHRRGVITVRSWEKDNEIVVAISDTGTGIPAAIRDQIFDPFFTTKEVGMGSGQGLAISRAVVVDKHKGSLTFETEEGQGSTFFVRLPILFQSLETPLENLLEEMQ